MSVRGLAMSVLMLATCVFALNEMPAGALRACKPGNPGWCIDENSYSCDPDTQLLRGKCTGPRNERCCQGVIAPKHAAVNEQSQGQLQPTGDTSLPETVGEIMSNVPDAATSTSAEGDVESADAVVESMTDSDGTEQADTENDPNAGVAQHTPGVCPVSNLPPACVPDGDWEVRCKSKDNDPRTVAFQQGFQIHAPMTNPRARILEVANAVVECDLHMGSCGGTAGKIWTFAGLSGKGGGPGFGRHVFESSDYVKKAMEFKLWQGCTSEKTKASREAALQSQQQPTKAEAVQKMRDYVTAQKQMERVEKLKPGDWVWIYNANGSCGGGHSFIFMGWSEEKKGRADIVQSSWGKHPSRGTICLKTSCNKWAPIIRIMRAIEVRQADQAAEAGSVGQ